MRGEVKVLEGRDGERGDKIDEQCVRRRMVWRESERMTKKVKGGGWRRRRESYNGKH